MNIFEKLKQATPDLFYKDDDGKMYITCMSDCPTGWEKIVYDLCMCIDDYTKHTTINGKAPPDVKIGWREWFDMQSIFHPLLVKKRENMVSW